MGMHSTIPQPTPAMEPAVKSFQTAPDAMSTTSDPSDADSDSEYSLPVLETLAAPESSLSEYTRSPSIPNVMSAAIAKGTLCEENPVALFMDLARLRGNIEAVHAALPGWTHAFAVKANPLKGTLHEVCKAGGGAECASIFEVEHAVRQGFDPSKVIFDSPCKTSKELIRCFELGVLVNLDCMEEVQKVAQLLEQQQASWPDIKQHVRIGIRINPQVGAGSIACTSTATATSKFGVGITDYHDEILAAYQVYPWLRGLHCHVGSQGCELEMLVEGAMILVNLAKRINQEAGHQQVTMLDIGGGMSVNYWSDEDFPTYSQYAELLKARVPELFDGSFKVFTEFGRSLVQKSGWIGSRIEFTKKAGGKNIATVHCGSNMLLRTCYLPEQWKHDVTVLTPEGDVKAGSTEVYDIAGPLCFSADLIAKDRPLPHIQAGDHMVIHDCGGYTYAMYSRYNSRPAPPVYAYESSAPQNLIVWKEAETFEDVCAFWG